MVDKICTNCGYEGQPVKRPSDQSSEPSDTKAAFDKLCRIVTMATFIPVKPLAMAMVAPIYVFIIWPIKLITGSGGGKWCPNCGLPLMVSLKSDAGWLAKRKNDIKAGAIKIDTKETPKVAFGKEFIVPGDVVAEEVRPPRPEKLPTLDEMLAPEPENTGEAEPEPAKTQPEEIKPPKPPKPDGW